MRTDCLTDMPSSYVFVKRTHSKRTDCNIFKIIDMQTNLEGSTTHASNGYWDETINVPFLAIHL